MSSCNAGNQTTASAESLEDVRRQLLAFGIEPDEISKLTVEQQKEWLESFGQFPYGSVPSGQGEAGAVEQDDDIYEEHFFDGELGQGVERELRGAWLSSPSAKDRETIAFQGYRKRFKLKEDAELTEFVVGQLRPFAENQNVEKGWDQYMQRLGQLTAPVRK